MSRPRPGSAVDPVEGEPATGRVTCKLPIGAALEFSATVDEIADALHDQLPAEDRETITRGELQARAVELLTHPAAAAALLAQIDEPAADSAAEPDDRAATKRKRRPATVYVHVSDLTLAGAVDGVARVEGLGPMLLDQLTGVLDHHDVTLQPVIDLHQVSSVNGYEHPTPVKHRTLLRTVGDVFPHSANRGYRRLDHDHATPYLPVDRGGPPGQTGDHNDAPLTRHHHRAKTHAGFQVDQLALGAYRWITPHGLARLRDPAGTRPVGLLRQRDGTVVGETYAHGPPVRLELSAPGARRR